MRQGCARQVVPRKDSGASLAVCEQTRGVVCERDGAASHAARGREGEGVWGKVKARDARRRMQLRSLCVARRVGTAVRLALSESLQVPLFVLMPTSATRFVILDNEHPFDRQFFEYTQHCLLRFEG